LGYDAKDNLTFAKKARKKPFANGNFVRGKRFFLFFTNILESGDLPVAGIVLSDGTVIGAEHFEELPSIGYAMQMFSVHNYTTLITEVYQYFA